MLTEWVKFRDYNLAKGSELSDWDAAWRMWLDKRKAPQSNGHDTKPEIEMNEEELRRHAAGHRVYVKQDSPAGEAWATWCREKLLKSQVWDAKGGWWFPSEYPPDFVELRSP